MSVSDIREKTRVHSSVPEVSDILSITGCKSPSALCSKIFSVRCLIALPINLTDMIGFNGGCISVLLSKPFCFLTSLPTISCADEI